MKFDLSDGKKQYFGDAVTELSPLKHIKDDLNQANNKSLIVPNSMRYHINWVYCELETNDFVLSDRLLQLCLIDSDGDQIFKISAGSTQNAPSTKRYIFYPGVKSDTAFINDQLCVCLPSKLFLNSGMQLKLSDSNNVNESGDNLKVYYALNYFAGTK